MSGKATNSLHNTCEFCYPGIDCIYPLIQEVQSEACVQIINNVVQTTCPCWSPTDVQNLVDELTSLGFQLECEQDAANHIITCSGTVPGGEKAYPVPFVIEGTEGIVCRNLDDDIGELINEVQYEACAAPLEPYMVDVP